MRRSLTTSAILASLLIASVAAAQVEYPDTATPPRTTIGVVMGSLNQAGKFVPQVLGTTGNLSGLTASTSSATIASLLTSNAGNAVSWSKTAGNVPGGFYVQNFGTTDIAVCIHGGTCTCLESGVAATNGTTIRFGSSFGFFGHGTIAYDVPTIVACSGTDPVEIDY